MIYGDNLDNTLLEHAVRWIIVLIVIVFDPMAVMLLLACQHTFSQIRETTVEIVPEIIEVEPIIEEKQEITIIPMVLSEEEVNTGDVFPDVADVGQTFTRTDYTPPRTFVFNGDQWVDSDNYKT